MHHVTPANFNFAVKSSTWWENPAPLTSLATAIGFCLAISYDLALCIQLLPIAVQFEVRWVYQILQISREEAIMTLHNGENAQQWECTVVVGSPATHVGEHM